MRLGAAGFVDKTAPLAYVIQAIDTVMAGGMFFASHVQAESTSVGGSLPPASEVPPSALSARELEVACLVAAGRSSKEVASDLDLSTRTVEKHRANIMSSELGESPASFAGCCKTVWAELASDCNRAAEVGNCIPRDGDAIAAKFAPEFAAAFRNLL